MSLNVPPYIARSRPAGAGSRDDQSLVESVALRTLRLACHEGARYPMDREVGMSSQQRANALAVRLEQGARALASFATTLTDAEWQTRFPRTGARSASSCITSRRCTRWRSSWHRRSPEV